jgi:transporter family-2 protein
MSHEHHIPVTTIVVAAVSGAMIGIQSRANGSLAMLLGNSREAALISFGSGFALLLAMSIISPRLRDGLRAVRAAVGRRDLPKWQLLAGMIGAWFVIVQTVAVPITGVAVFSVATIAGQSAASLAVDRLGLRSGVSHRITSRRVVTALVTVVAVAVSVADRVEGSGGWITLIAFVVGGAVAVQRALNAHITDYSEHSYATTWLNFATGVALLLVANFAFGAKPLAPLPGLDRWFDYTGGVIGVVYIAVASVLVQRLGVLMFTATSVGGQLLGSLLIDLLFPTPGVTIAWNVYLGVLLSCAGILAGTRRSRANAG